MVITKNVDCVEEEVPEGHFKLPIDKCDIIRTGTDVTMVSWGSPLQQILKNGGQIIASKRWAKQHTDEKNRHAMPGTVLLNDEDVCDFILERSGAIIDY